MVLVDFKRRAHFLRKEIRMAPAPVTQGIEICSPASTFPRKDPLRSTVAPRRCNRHPLGCFRASKLDARE